MTLSTPICVGSNRVSNRVSWKSGKMQHASHLKVGVEIGTTCLSVCQTRVRSLLEDHAGEETSRVPGRRETLYRHSKQLPHHAHVVRGEGVEHVPRLLV